MDVQRLRKIICLTGVAAMLQGCALHGVAPQAGGTEAIANVRVVGDTEWYFGKQDGIVDRPTAYVRRIDGEALRSSRYKSLTVPAGQHVYQIECLLPPTESNRGTPAPFQTYENGVGGLFGTEKGGVRAMISLQAKLEIGSSYDLTCMPIGNMRARAQFSLVAD